MYVEQALAEYGIESDVCAVGLSFKDLLVTMGEIAQPGFRHEAAGIVRTIASSVGGFLPGDRVVFFLDILSRAEWASRAATVASIWIWRLRYPKSQLRNCRTASHLWNSDLFLESLLGFVLVIRSWFTLPLVAFGRLRFNTQR
jgi:hypothetical protein